MGTAEGWTLILSFLGFLVALIMYLVGHFIALGVKLKTGVTLMPALTVAITSLALLILYFYALKDFGAVIPLGLFVGAIIPTLLFLWLTKKE